MLLHVLKLSMLSCHGSLVCPYVCYCNLTAPAHTAAGSGCGRQEGSSQDPAQLRSHQICTCTILQGLSQLWTASPHIAATATGRQCLHLAVEAMLEGALQLCCCLSSHSLALHAISACMSAGTWKYA